MHAQVGNRVLLAALLLTAIATPASAQVSDEAQCGTSLPTCTALRTSCCTRTFDSTATQKAILIPTDRCHQPFTNSVPQGGADVGDATPKWCAGNPAQHGNSQTFIYGLIYRLMQNRVPVHWIVNPSKAPTTYGGITPTSTEASTKDVDFWILSSTATPPNPSTGSLTGTTGPVNRLSVSNVGSPTLVYGNAGTYNRNEFPIRGGAYVIAPEDRTAFDNFMKTSLGRTTCGSTGFDCYNFIDNNGVYLYEIQPGAKLVWQDYTQPLVAGKYAENVGTLPVAMRIDYSPPKVAVVPGTVQMSAILQQANLNDLENTASCKLGTFTIPGKIGCQLTETDVNTNNYLVTTSFNNVWVDLAAPTSCGTFATKLQNFATAIYNAQTGGNIILFGDSIADGETCATARGALLGRPGTGLTMVGTTINDSVGNPFIIRHPANLLAQYGDLPLNFASGSIKGWDRVAGVQDNYNPIYYTGSTGNTLRRLMTQEMAGTNCSNHKDTNVVGAASAAGCDSGANNTNPGDYRDIFSYGRYLNNKRNGVVFYSPGNNPATDPTKSHMRLILGTLIAVPPFVVEQVFNNIEVTRSSPIVALVNGTSSIVQGTYEYHFKTDGTTQYTVPRTIPTVFVPDDVNIWTFPALIGHLRAVPSASVDTAVLDLSTGSTLNASAGEGSASTDTFPSVTYSGCSPPFDGTCRGVWTTTTTGFTPASQVVGEGNTTVSSLMLPESGFAATNPLTGRTYRADFVRKVLKGFDAGAGYVPQLGGVDRSTVAVIGPGASIGASRPTIAYIGATDGMLHAICMDTVSPCLRRGMELWAYIPRTNLPELRYNIARVDASARVLDAKITGLGIKTVLLIQAGSESAIDGATPAIYALDVSDPTQPSVLWEYATFSAGSTGAPKTPTARPANGLGMGMNLAAGQATIAAATKNVVIAHTNNGGTGANGSYVIAIDMDTGNKIWDRFYTYPSTTVATGFFAPRVQPTINIPSTAIPPGPTPIDKTLAGSNGFMTDIVVGDLYGNLWLLNPADGTSRTKDASLAEIPLFQFTTDYHSLTQPAIYTEGGVEYAVFTTGGYVDYSTSPLWGSNAANQYLAAVNLNSTAVTAPLTQLSAVADVPINQSITGLGFSQVRVVGTEIFATTDSSNVNASTFGSATADSGRVYGYNYGTNTAITAIAQTRTGASSIINDGTDLFASSGGKRQQLANSATGLEYDAAGNNTGERTRAADEVTMMARKLWLRTE